MLPPLGRCTLEVQTCASCRGSTVPCSSEAVKCNRMWDKCEAEGWRLTLFIWYTEYLRVCMWVIVLQWYKTDLREIGPLQQWSIHMVPTTSLPVYSNPLWQLEREHKKTESLNCLKFDHGFVIDSDIQWHLQLPDLQINWSHSNHIPMATRIQMPCWGYMQSNRLADWHFLFFSPHKIET